MRDSNTPSMMLTGGAIMYAPSPFWGTERIWTAVHNPMFDEKERVWLTARDPVHHVPQEGFRPSIGATVPGGKSRASSRYLQPKTKKFTLIDTCFSTHHLVFAEDANNTLWLSSGGAGSGILGVAQNTFDETGDEQKSQGWVRRSSSTPTATANATNT